MINDPTDQLIALALEEDLGKEGDITSRAIFTDEQGTAVLWTKQKGVLAGLECFKKVFTAVDPNIQVSFGAQDGAILQSGAKIAEVKGSLRSLLSAERTALNFLGYLSGIATKTYKLVYAARKKGSTVLLDTRKTLPGFRALAKYAVRLGQGQNHRMGLYDMVLIKDNHIDAAGSITQAVKKVREQWNSRFLIEVECRTLAEVQEALALKADRIMLDNMPLPTIRKAIQLTKGRIPLEASGNMNEKKIAKTVQKGLAFISVGELTHSVDNFDFSLKIQQ